MIQLIRRAGSESLELKRSFFAVNEERIAALAKEICRVLDSAGKILLFGNGGSAADAQHIAAELVGRFQVERRPLAAIALTTDTSILTSVANDLGYDQIFVRQVKALGRRGDLAIAISTSGKSPNVLLPAEAANELGLMTAGFTGCDGGKLGLVVRYHFNVPPQASCTRPGDTYYDRPPSLRTGGSRYESPVSPACPNIR